MDWLCSSVTNKALVWKLSGVQWDSQRWHQVPLMKQSALSHRGPWLCCGHFCSLGPKGRMVTGQLQHHLTTMRCFLSSSNRACKFPRQILVDNQISYLYQDYHQGFIVQFTCLVQVFSVEIQPLLSVCMAISNYYYSQRLWTSNKQKTLKTGDVNKTQRKKMLSEKEMLSEGKKLVHFTYRFLQQVLLQDVLAQYQNSLFHSQKYRFQFAAAASWGQTDALLVVKDTVYLMLLTTKTNCTNNGFPCSAAEKSYIKKIKLQEQAFTE